MRSLLPSGALVLMLGCASVQRVPLKREDVRLADGRFIGPLEIPVPRRADHQGHDFEIHVTLKARCAPKMVLAFPDGETQSLGANDQRWQDLLALRARGEQVNAQQRPAPVAPMPLQGPPQPDGPLPYPGPSTSSAVPAAPMPLQRPPPQPDGPLPYPGPSTSSAGVAVDAQVVIPLPQQPAGHWENITTETWTGQLAFERARAERCAEGREYRASYLNAFDETGMLTLWAEVPQELRDASLSYEIVELVPPKVEAPAPVGEHRAVAVAVAVNTPPKPRPPQPAPKHESPPAPGDARATWIPGQWSWDGGEGEWVWHGGSWRAPSAPALQVEMTGPPPNVGCTWASGYWTWEGREGRWVWQGGHWNAPPPLNEPRVDAPDPGAPWISGEWRWGRGSFVWTPGHWGQPPRRAETPPAPPFSGAQWVRGDWILVSGRWVWSPGFYEGAQRPPPPRAENPGVAPGPGAVWLQGYWRWDVARTEFVWVDGHWERPPGEGYVWVPEPQGAGGIVIRGHWELRVRVTP